MKTFTYTSIGNYVKPKLEGGRELVNALKSGKYAKGKSMLRDEEYNYCCLGVKCDLDGYYKENSKEFYKVNYIHGGSTVLPIGHPWIQPHGNVLYFPNGFLVNYYLSINPNEAIDRVRSIAALNDLTEDFSMVINLLEAAWDCV